jgi:hypothetical protein
METNRLEIESVVIYIVAFFMFMIGLNFHIKIIVLSKKEKNTITSKLDITNSLVLIVLHQFSLIMHVVTDIVPDLYTYTGEWFCYTWKVLAHYATLYHIGHSLVVCILKYTIIVKWQKVINFRETRVKEICFWINLLHPILGLAIHLMVRPDFIFAFSGISPSNRCLGEEINDGTQNNNTSKSHLYKLCDIQEDHDDNWFYHSIFIGRKILCVLQTIGIYLIAWNIFEIFFYYQIFSFAYR